mgnify:CR=1 FL=1
MTLITNDENHAQYALDDKYKKNHRLLTVQEITVLVKNHCTSSDPEWRNIWVSNDGFCPELVHECSFSGFVVIGRMQNARLKYHDLQLTEGLYSAYIENCVIGNDCVVRNVEYLVNYHIADRVILFNIQEMSATNHAKFGNGILKEGEEESSRYWISVCNENDGRAVLAHEDMITADAYLWATYREDKELQKRFIELTENGNTKTLDTFGIVESDTVIKNTTLLKDVKIGSFAYIKGAFKLKNITVLSSEKEPSQIGEGVELVNGIMGYGSKAFYQAVAVRFILGRNCQLKYGARLLNSILGDNSTVSCCELLNNLIFPFHEQHHNSSFLIASLVQGQSNIAAGATIGSNHNSRSPDGEIQAGRGFWPGLNSSFKHNSKFASFTLASKGTYLRELNIMYPFSLIATHGVDQAVHILPAYWFMYNMFAIARNNSKFKKRDKRVVKVQHIETNPLAPDTIQEVLPAIDRLIELTGVYLRETGDESANNANDENELYCIAKDYLHHHKADKITLFDPECQKKYGAYIFKGVQAYVEYRKILKYFSLQTLLEYVSSLDKISLSKSDITTLRELPLFTKWINAGGQVMPEEKAFELFDKIKRKEINDWKSVHAFYDECEEHYLEYKSRYAIYILEWLYSAKLEDFTSEIFKDIIADVTIVSDCMYRASIESREKDYTDFFRKTVYRNDEEMTAVLGTIEDNSFLQEMKESTEIFDRALGNIFAELLES